MSRAIKRIPKYLRLERFLSILAGNRLYLPSANQFIDPLEGARAVNLNLRRLIRATQ
jgi:hypothetical protein